MISSGNRNSIHVPDRNAVIDLLKFIFAIMIVLYHSKSFSGDEPRIITGGYIAVDFFFVVSGYYLALSASAPSASPSGSGHSDSVGKETFYYICRRLRRLYPEFISASIIALIVRSAVLHWGLKEAAVNVLKAAGEWSFLQLAGFNTGGLVGASWFLSALLLASVLIFPLARKYKESFFYLGAPMIFIFLFGFTYSTLPHFQSYATPVLAITNVGMVRAIMELSAGCFVFILVKELNKSSWNSVMRAALSVLEVFIFGALIVYYSSGSHYNKIDWYAILLIIAGVTITQTNLCYSAAAIRGRFFEFLGKISFDLYLGHRSWSLLINRMDAFSGLTYMQKIPVYLVLSFCTAGLIMGGGKMINMIFQAHIQKTRDGSF